MIYIFTIKQCPTCKNLKYRLNQVGLPFKEVDVTTNRGLWKEVKRQVGHDCLLPTVFVPSGLNGEGEIYEPEVNFSDIDEMIKILVDEVNK